MTFKKMRQKLARKLKVEFPELPFVLRQRVAKLYSKNQFFIYNVADLPDVDSVKVELSDFGDPEFFRVSCCDDTVVVRLPVYFRL